METWVDPTVRFEGRIFTVRAGAITLDNGQPAYREVVEHPGGVCVLPFDGKHVTLVKQYRIALGEYIIEAPAGKLEPGDDPAKRAEIELEEETGLRPIRLISAGQVYGSVGFCTERIHLFFAPDVIQVSQQLEPEERIELLKFTLDEISELLSSQSLTDAKTICLLTRFQHWMTHSGAGL